MSSVKNSVGVLLRKYLVEENILKNDINNKEFDFGFIISFPPGPRSQNLSVYKPKNRNDIFVTIRFQISPDKAVILNSFKEKDKQQIFNDLRKYLLSREVFFKINTQDLIIEIHEQIFPNKKNYISKNSLFKLILKVFYSYLYSNIILEEYLKEKKPR